MTFAKRQARMARENPITDKHKLWAAWFWGCISHHFPGRIRGPVHPQLAAEFHHGNAAAARGYVQLCDYALAVELARHVEAGNPPHSFRGDQLGMAL